MKLLLDQGLGRSTARDLRSHGWDVAHVGELGLHRTEDPDIVRRAAAEGRAIVTIDADFNRFVVTGGEPSVSVVRLRIGGIKAPAMTALLLEVLPPYEADLLAGAFVTIAHNGVRVRRLPIDE